jgi:Ca2+-binding EF-hand superfamily protein
MTRAGYTFSAEACKMMVNMFDRDGNGQISFDEFEQLHRYIVDMQAAFRTVDKDSSGRLEPAEVMDALSTSGYRLSPQTFSAMMKKLDRHRRGSLGFDGYIELCVFIGTARNVYADFDVQRQGTVSFTFDQFVYAANRTNFL